MYAGGGVVDYRLVGQRLGGGRSLGRSGRGRWRSARAGWTPGRWPPSGGEGPWVGPTRARRGIGPARARRARRAAPALTLVAARAYHGLLARLDADAGYRPRFTLDLDAAQPALLHDDYWDSVDLAGRGVDSLLRLRRLLGVADAAEAEHGLRAYLLARQDADGLFANEATAAGGEVVDVFCQSRALLGLVTWYASSGAAEIGDALDRLVAGLGAVAAHQGDGSYFPGVAYHGRWLDQELTGAGATDGRARYGYGALCAQGLLELYALTGHRPALELAGRLLQHFVEQAGLVSAEGHFVGETHAEGYLPLATAAVRYGAAVGDERYVAWAERLYRWVRANSSSFGWVPGPLGLDAAYFATWYGTPARRTCETCSLADAIELALTLAQHGYPAYWDDVERFARNQLVENQYGSAEATLGAEAAADADPSLLAALAGAWESFALPYRLLGRPDGRRLVEGCCSGSGARALSLVWEHAVNARDGTLAVHLGLTRETPWASVASHEPGTAGWTSTCASR